MIELPTDPKSLALPYWRDVAAHGQSRESMASYICSFGSRYYLHCAGGAVCFNVKMYGLDWDVEKLWEAALNDGGDMPEGTEDMVLAAFTQAYKEQENMLLQYAQESVYNQFKECGGYLFTGNEVTFKCELQGRLSGWLVITEVDNFSIGDDVADLREKLLDPEETPDAQMDNIFAFIVQCEHGLTPETLEADFIHAAAWELWHVWMDDIIKDMLQVQRTQALAERLLPSIQPEDFEDFRLLCVRSGVKLL